MRGPPVPLRLLRTSPLKFVMVNGAGEGRGEAHGGAAGGAGGRAAIPCGGWRRALAADCDARRRRARGLTAPYCVCVCVCLAAGPALGALDEVHGPRVHRESPNITSLQRQLQEAVLMGDTKLLNITNLITAGADPNGYDELHMTPLHWAVIKGQRLCVELLLQRGAHTDVRDSSDRTPMHFVAIYGWFFFPECASRRSCALPHAS